MSRRVLVTDAHDRSTLAATRCLGRAGYDVTAAAHQRPALAHWSRWCREPLWVPDPRSDPGAFVAALARAAPASGDGILVPGGDISVVAVSEQRHLLEPHLSTGLPAHETVMRCMDKQLVLHAAERAGLAAPVTIHCHDAEAARAAAGELGYPVVVKQRHSVFRRGGRLARRGSALIGDAGQLARLLPSFGDEYLLQRREPGPVHSWAGVTTGDRLLGLAVSRYERTWPAEAGNVSSSVSVDQRPKLAEDIERLLAALGWRGMFEIELIQRGDGSLAVIDFNPRLYGSLALAVEAGAPLPALWCDWLAGDRGPRPTAVARADVRYRWEEAETRNLLRALRARDVERMLAILLPRHHVARALFRRDDPRPLAARAAFLAGRLARRVRMGGERRAGERGGPGASPRARRPPGSPTVAVLGAGPYGLSTGAHLRAAGVEATVFGEAMEFWHTRMPHRMLLRSSPRASHIADPDRRLTLDDYAHERGVELANPLPVERFLDYAGWFQARAVPELDSRRVQEVTSRNGGFVLRLSDGEETTFSRVVLAAGLAPFAHRPAQFAELPPQLVSHSSDHVDFRDLAGRRVLVVGAGQSGLEAAAALREAGGEVEVVVRRGDVVWLPGLRDRSGLRFPLPPTDVGGRVSGWVAAAPDVFRRLPGPTRSELAWRCVRPAGAAWLRARLEGVPLIAGREIARAQEAGNQVEVVLDDGVTRVVDHVLLATGFRVDVAAYPFLSRQLTRRLRLRDGYPPLGPGLESAVPRLHFLGAPAAMTFGPVMRFVVGTWYAAPAVARAALGRRQPPLRWSF